MNKKLLIFTISSFVGGVAIGGVIGFLIGKNKASKESDIEKEAIDISDEKESEDENRAENVQTYTELIDELEYRSNNDEEEFTEEDQEELESHRQAEDLRRYKEERGDLIEEISEDMYYSDSDETGDLILGYDSDDLYYFEEQGVLVTDLGELKYPIEHFVGDILSRSDKDKYYVRNHIEEFNYRVVKRDPDEKVEDYFPDVEY